MKSKMKLSGQLRSYLRWPLILSILMLVMNIGMYFVDVMAGMWFTLFFCSLCDRSRSSLLQTASAGDQRADYLCDRIRPGSEASDPGTGAALCRYGFAGKLLWVNKEFTKITGKDTQYHKCIATIFPELTNERLPKNEEETDINVALRRKEFPCPCKSVCIDELIQNSEMINTDIKVLFYSGTVSVR